VEVKLLNTRRLRHIQTILVSLIMGGISPVLSQGRLDSVPRLEQVDTLSLLSGSAQEAMRDSTLTSDSVSIVHSPRTRHKDVLESKIDYQAEDSIILLGNGTAFLHGKGDVKYEDMTLTSDFIRVKTDSNLVYASGVQDSTGEWHGKPVFKDKKDTYESDEMTYNIKTKKGFIRRVVTTQGEGHIIAGRTKKVEDNVMCLAEGKYSTCDDHEHPHFYLAMTKAKVKPGKYIATGPAYLVVGDVPVPLAIPFGFFPFNDKYASGLIMPTFGDDYSRGLYLRGLGYYFAINDYMDLKITGDIYSRGTWAIKAQTRYVKRYKFNGNFSVDFRQDVTGEKDMPDYSKANNLSIQWTHTQDAKANPYCNFSAGVNFSTSGYSQSNINNYYNSALNSQNTKSSSINYTQRFPNSPWSISLSALVSQQTKDSIISLSLPDITVSMSRIYPFKRKKAVGKEKWYEKISMQYTANISNQISCKETYLFHSNFVNDWNNGIKHTLPINASFMLFKYLSITPSISLTDRMYFRRIDQRWDDAERTVVKDTTNSFYNVFDFNVGISMSTKLYGYYTPIRKWFGDKVDKFRHVFTPQISFNYHPDFGNNFWGYYGSYDQPVYGNTIDPKTGLPMQKVDEKGTPIFQHQTYNRYAGSLYGTPGQGAQGTLSFSLGNNLEMKIRDKKDTTGTKPYKVVSLIDNLTIGGGYNFIADSMNWQNFVVNLRLKLPLNYTLSLTGQFDPYMYELDALGKPIHTNKQYWHNKMFPRFLGTGTTISYTFSHSLIQSWIEKGQKKNQEKNKSSGQTEEGQENRHKSSGNDANFHKTEIPWSLSIHYTISFAQGSEFDYDKMVYKYELNHNLSLSGTINFGKGWKASASTSYDFKAKQFTYTNFSITRDLHCWTMSASFVPFGRYKSYTFHIGVNASMLSDLKYDKNSNASTNKTTNWW